MPTTLTITLDDAGSIGVNGPIGNAILCYGMMEAAKDAIKEYGKQQNDKRVQLAAGPIPNLKLVD